MFSNIVIKLIKAEKDQRELFINLLTIEMIASDYPQTYIIMHLLYFFKQAISFKAYTNDVTNVTL